MRLLLGLIVVSTLLRAGYDLMVDPRNSLDSATYHDIAAGFATHGLLSFEVPFLPYYPGGYPLFLGGLYAITGTEPELARLLSLAALGVTVFLAWHLIARELGERLAWLVAAVLAFSLALTGVASVLSYEPLLGALLVFATDQISRAVRASGRAVTLHGLAAGAALGYAVIVQSKAALVLVILAVWLLYRTRRALAVGLLVLAAVPLPVAYGLRTEDVHGRFQFASTNFGANLVNGFSDPARGTFVVEDALPPRCQVDNNIRYWRTDPFERDEQLQSCATDWINDNPEKIPLLELRKLRFFFGPSIGQRGSALYMHHLDPRDLLPESVLESSTYGQIDAGLRTLWAIIAIAALAWGFYLLWRVRRQPALVWFAIVAGFVLATLITVGDARYRYPVLTFTLSVQGVTALWLYELVRAQVGWRRFAVT